MIVGTDFSQMADTISNISPEVNANKKRQLYTRQGSYVIDTSDIPNKEILSRYVQIFDQYQHSIIISLHDLYVASRSKEEHLNQGEELKKDFKPSPELRITSPIYQPSAPAHHHTVSNGYILPRPYSKPVSVSDIILLFFLANNKEIFHSLQKIRTINLNGTPRALDLILHT